MRRSQSLSSLTKIILRLFSANTFWVGVAGLSLPLLTSAINKWEWINPLSSKALLLFKPTWKRLQVEVCQRFGWFLSWFKKRVSGPNKCSMVLWNRKHKMKPWTCVTLQRLSTRKADYFCLHHCCVSLGSSLILGWQTPVAPVNWPSALKIKNIN